MKAIISQRGKTTGDADMLGIGEQPIEKTVIAGRKG